MLEMITRFMEFFEHLWRIDCVFKVNFFFILYFFAGPLIICYMKPQMSFLKRNLLMWSAIIVSLACIILGITYSRQLEWYEHYECERKFGLNGIELNELCPPPGGIPNEYKKNEIITKPKIEKIEVKKDLSIFKWIQMILILTLIIIIFISLHPFMSVPIFLWFLWHRKTIKAMGDKFEGKKSLFFMMFGWIWFPPVVMLLVAIFILLDSIFHIIIDSVSKLL